jgi:hypothetical protein
MLSYCTPIEDYTSEYGLWVKREDLACPPPGPPFSKTRGVFAHIVKIPSKAIGVLDTYHSQAGWAVARACQVLGKRCINFYPEFKQEPGYREPQERAAELGAELVGLPAGRSAVLYHRAKAECAARHAYMMPNALKLHESVSETAGEVSTSPFASDAVIISASSGTIAAGVMRGYAAAPGGLGDTLFIVHLGYTRSHACVAKYLEDMAGNFPLREHRRNLLIVDEKYSYRDQARPGETPPWPCNPYYDLKAFRWWLSARTRYRKRETVLFWNVG